MPPGFVFQDPRIVLQTACRRWMTLGWGSLVITRRVVDRFQFVGFLLIEEKGSKLAPNSRVCPMLAQDICWVDTTWDVGKYQHLGSHSFANTMEGQHGVTLVELGVHRVGTVDNSLVVSKHVGLVSDRYTEIT